VDRTGGTLLRRIKDPNDATAWREFDRIYRPLLLRYARARGLSDCDADDIAQQCMESVGRGMATFDYAGEKGGFKHWLHRIVENKATDLCRKRRLPLARTRDLNGPDPAAESPADTWERHWETEHLQYCLRHLRRELPDKTYRMFHLYALQERTADEVATMLGVTRNQVWLTKSRVLKQLRQMMVTLFGTEQADY
jgi:RNA polymerase sigma factor (sigma-70 family)